MYISMVGNKNLPNLLETDEPPSTSVNAINSSSSCVRRPLSTMNDVSIGGRHLVSEVQVWWANCLHEDDGWTANSTAYSHWISAYLHQIFAYSLAICIFGCKVLKISSATFFCNVFLSLLVADQNMQISNEFWTSVSGDWSRDVTWQILTNHVDIFQSMYNSVLAVVVVNLSS